MVRVQMSDDIRNIETKMIGSLTAKQLKCVGLAIFVLFLEMLIIPVPDLFVRFMISMPLVILFVLPGWVSIYKEPFSVFLTRFIIYSFIVPPKRKIVRKNSYKEDLQKLRKAKETARLKKMTPAQRKAYTKSKGQVVYSTKEKYKCYK